MFRMMSGMYGEMAGTLARKDPEAGKELASSQLALFFDPKVRKPAEV